MSTPSKDMTTKIDLIIPDTAAGQRIDQTLAQLYPDLSRARLQNAIKQSNILVNQKAVKPKDKVQGGEHITGEIEAVIIHTNAAEAIPLDILFEDEHIMILNKPVGLVVHPGSGNPSGTLLNALLHHAPELEILPRAGIVHRLDKDTSGLMVVAKSTAAHTHLVAAMQAREITREYEAICCGVMTAGRTVETEISRHPKQRTKMAVAPEGYGKPAITHIRVIKRYQAHTHVRATLETGRTHQIRVHMAHIGYPLVGDPLYGRRLLLPKGATPEVTEALRSFKRQALHAKRLALTHPITKASLEWEVSLPTDMTVLLNLLPYDQD